MNFIFVHWPYADVLLYRNFITSFYFIGALNKFSLLYSMPKLSNDLRIQYYIIESHKNYLIFVEKVQSETVLLFSSRKC